VRGWRQWLRRQWLRRRWARVLSVATLVLTASCSGLHSDQVPTQLYNLVPAAPPTESSGDSPMSGTTLKLVAVLTAPGLDTARIALTRDGQRLDYYAHSLWVAPLPELVQARALEALRAAGRFRVVHGEGAPFSGDYVLQLEIRRFQADYAGGAVPTVRVQLVATLGRSTAQRAMSSFVAERDVVAGANRVQAVAAAFESALGAALTALTAQVAPLPAPTPP